MGVIVECKLKTINGIPWKELELFDWSGENYKASKAITCNELLNPNKLDISIEW